MVKLNLLIKKKFKINIKPKIKRRTKKEKLKKELPEGIIAELKGTNGKLILYEDKLVISRDTLGGLAVYGNCGEKTFYYHALQRIE